MGNLADKIGKFEPLRQYAFRMFILKSATGVKTSSEHFELAIRDAFVPNRATEEIEIDVDNEKIFYAGKTVFEPGSVVIKDYVDAEVCRFIDEWADAVYNPATGLSGYKSAYAGEAIVQQYDPNGAIVREWKLKNIWPVSVDHGALTQASAEPVELTCNFRYDRAVKVLG